MRALRTAVLFALVLAPAARAQSSSDAAAAAATITPADVKAHIAYIASDELKGRDTPSPGLEAAAKYIADHFKSYGLKPAGDSGTYLQRWPYQTRRLDTSKLRAELTGTHPHTLKYGSEYFVIPAMMGDSLVGEITFVGPASLTAAPNPAYTGKIVAFAIPGGSMTQDWAKVLQTAAIAGIGSGAKGVVFILDKDFDQNDVAEVVANVGGVNTPVAIMGVRNDVAAAWLAGTSADMTKPLPTTPNLAAVTGASINLRTGMNGVSSNPPNVVGILEGSDPVLRNTYVIYSAHMDHIGVSAPNAKGDSINNGADDDASGTTAVLELAQAFSSLKTRPKRSIIFLTVSGEEKGLFGSKYFTEHPPVPADKIVADINIDMIGRNNPDTTVAIGQEYTSLGATTQVVAKAHPELHLTVAPDLWPQEGLFFRSDHFNFAVKNIPAIFFTSGLHDDYHKPSDEPQTIDNDKLARTARLVFWLGHDIANNATAPTWTEAGRKAVSQAASEQ